jgi:TPR repeat protein
MYAKGEGVPQDYVFAHMWLNLAAARSHSGTKNAAKDRDFIAKKNMTPDQVAEA